MNTYQKLLLSIGGMLVGYGVTSIYQAQKVEPQIAWSGNSLFTTVSNGQTNSIVIGLRNDGVMVWRLSTNN